ncbi:MAG: hypothetical protein KKD18_06170 [Nanoarchaeota archaeon]|nr:hypothetical protein [Nanoarchaeota archaeon]MBU0977978.1 hypothetical protein [Nanoarchaeota archaeon]
MLLNKKGERLITGTVIFVILNLTVIIVLIVAVSRSGSGASLSEEAYAKQIALLIDAAKPGTTLNIDITEIYLLARDNNINPNVFISCETNEVYVRAAPGQGYRFNFFTELKQCDFTIDNAKRRLTIRI